MDVFDAELDVRDAAVVVLDYRVADVDRVSISDVLEMLGLVEGDGRQMVIRLGFLDKLQLQMPCICAHTAAIAIVVDILGQENRRSVARAERLELLQYPDELGRHGVEIQDGININDRGEHFRGDLVSDEFLYSAAEFRKVLLLQGQPGGI